jgi:hypothetical protein
MLQAGTPSLTGGGPLAIVITLLSAWLFYAVTLHLAATFFIGETPTQLAAKAALPPAVVSLLLGQWGTTGVGPISASAGVAVLLLVLLLADGIAISYSYRLSTRSTVPLVALHLAFAVVLGIALTNIFGLL